MGLRTLIQLFVALKKARTLEKSPRPGTGDRKNWDPRTPWQDPEGVRDTGTPGILIGFFFLGIHFCNVLFIYLVALGLSFGMWDDVTRDLSLWCTGLVAPQHVGS